MSDDLDPNVQAVIDEHVRRAKLGLRKYGVTTRRDDLTLIDWLRHAQHEAMDQAIYLEAAIRDLESRGDGRPRENQAGREG